MSANRLLSMAATLFSLTAINVTVANVPVDKSATEKNDEYWQQFVHYQMEVALDPTTHLLTGTSRILYRNNSPDTLDRIYMYLYPNAYRDNQTVRAKEAARFYRKNIRNQEAGGWIHINEFRLNPKPGETMGETTMSAFQVDDTILRADLPQPMAPGEEIEIDLTFTEKVRQFQGRAGYRGSQYDFAQWYPKMCVYDEDGWHAEPFHLIGEFYGEFGTFDVSITVPFDYIVGATGVVTAGDPGWSLVTVDTSLTNDEWHKKYAEMKTTIAEQSQENEARTVTFHAEQVHDFAWITSPDFLYERGEYDGIPIHVLYRSFAKSRWSKIVTERGRRALEWLSTRFGRYPYPQLSITHGLLGGGMEYPMLVMNSSPSEGLILHEVGHIYFYGIFGNNEQKEAWLDEGFTSFQTRWYMETRYGRWGYDRDERMKEASWLERHRPQLTRNQSNRNWALYYMNSGHNEPISKYAYRYQNSLGYTVNAYTKGSIFYEMLRYVVGDETFEKICHEYFNRWALKHVNEARFRQVCEDVSGMDLGWFFQQWLHETKTVDYRLGKIKKSRNANGEWHTEVEIKRQDEGIMPVEVELTLDDGSKVTKRWQGREKTGVLSFATASRPAKVVLDPRDQVMDNSRLGQGNMRLELYPDYPRMFNYNPSDAYVLTWRPGGWYNDIDGARLGLRLKGKYRNTRNLEVAGWFGTKSSTLDGLFEFSNPLAPQTRYHLSAKKLEGRYFAGVSLTKSFSRALFTPPQWNLTLGLSYSELPADNSEYALSTVEVGDHEVSVPNWSVGKVNRAYLSFDVNPRGLIWRSSLRGKVAHANDAFGSDSSFTRVEGEARFWIANRTQEGIYLRLFAGTFARDEDDKPVQDLFSAFGASPREQFNRFYLRSRGALPVETHYHAPGGGNLRGYYDQPELAGKSLLAANLELRKAWQIPVLGKIIAPILGRSEVNAFLDAGRLNLISGNTSKNLADAGLGLTFNKRVPDAWYSFFIGTDFTIRLDFPIWVSQPRQRKDGSTEDNVKFRYVLSFQRAI